MMTILCKTKSLKIMKMMKWKKLAELTQNDNLLLRRMILKNEPFDKENYQKENIRVFQFLSPPKLKTKNTKILDLI